MRSTRDKQLQGIELADVLEKRRLGQALNLKEFAVLAGVSYSVAREWAQIPGFPRFQGVVFWEDFSDWRTKRQIRKEPLHPSETDPHTAPKSARSSPSGLPDRAARILLESGV